MPFLLGGIPIAPPAAIVTALTSLEEHGMARFLADVLASCDLSDLVSARVRGWVNRALSEEAARAASRMEDPSHRRRIVSQAVGAVQVEVDHLRITLNVQGLSAVFRRQFDSAIAAPVLTASGARVRQGRATKLVFAGDDGCATEVDPALIRLLREGQEARAATVRFPAGVILCGTDGRQVG